MIRSFIFWIFIGTWNFGSADETLRLVNMVFRHGDRSPVVNYPNNPDNISVLWPDGLGWLSEEGKKMEYSLGCFLRRRYDAFLGPRYNNEEVKVQSSSIERCLMSAYSNLACLFPPTGDQVWNSKIAWQPIPVETTPKEEDNMIAIDKPCAKYDQLYDASLLSDRIWKEESDNKDFYAFVRKHTGYATETIDNIWKIADTLFCYKQHNYQWPAWVNMTIYLRLRDLWRMNMDLMYHGRQESRLKGGPMIKDWIKATDKKVSDKNFKLKLNMYSGHDTTDIAVMNALQVYNHMLTPYTTAVIMELHQSSDGSHYVELYMRNHSSTDEHDDSGLVPLTLPDCEFQCPYDKFLTLTKDAVPGNWEEECALPVAEKEQTDFKTAFIAAVAVYSSVLLILLIVVIATCMKNRN